MENLNPLNNKPEIKQDKYMDLINDFGMFITLNATKIEQDVKPGREAELIELRQALRKPIINGMNYADFMSKEWSKLKDPIVAQALLTQIHGFLQYIEPRLEMLKEGNSWSVRFAEIKQKYIEVIKNN